MIKNAQLIFFFFILYVHSYVTPQRIYILIHGTWAQRSSWHMPGGEFFDILEQHINKKNDKIISFLWSGKLGHKARLHGAEALVLLMKSYPTDTEFILIGHSHGANVGFIVSQLLGKDSYNNHKIKHFVALGVPVDQNRYNPDMNVISYLYNLFSFNDLIQTIFGMAKREFLRHERIANLSITIEGNFPGHRYLIDKHIASWIPSLDQYINQDIFDLPATIYFMGNSKPFYVRDTKRNIMLEEDERINQMLLAAIEPFEDDGKPDQESRLLADMNQALQTIWQVQQLH